MDKGSPRIDNYIRNEYTGNHNDYDGDSKPRTKYGQVSLPSHLSRGMLHQSLVIPRKHMRHELAMGSRVHGFFVKNVSHN
jgi:hypothetical protein